MENEQSKNDNNDQLESLKLSEVYIEYDNLLLLHGMSRVGAIDRIPREMFDRYSKIKESRISGFLIQLGAPFKKWGDAGAIIGESIIIAAKNDDGGFDDVRIPVRQMKTDHIKSIVKEINNSNLLEHYSELFFKDTKVIGIYYIKEPEFIDYRKNDVRNTQEKFNIEKVYEIDHKSGSLFLVEWNGKEYEQVKRIQNREEFFNS